MEEPPTAQAFFEVILVHADLDDAVALLAESST